MQLAGERPSHPLVPSVHRGRPEIAELLRGALGRPDLGDDPESLLAAARQHLREAFLRARVAISGANFAVAETGTVAIVESEGNGRMCTTLPETLITVMGIEKVVEEWRDLGVLMQLLPRSATGERMNPYTSFWTGVSPAMGPVVPSRAARRRADAGARRPRGRPALRCIRCSACVNVCPVYRQTGGHAYDTVYAGPIGAILQPQLSGEQGTAGSLPYASSLCGACADVCPVGIDIPRILVHERAKVVRARPAGPGGRALRALGRAFSSAERYERAQRTARALQRPFVRDGRLRWLPGPLAGWGRSRTLPGVARRRSASGGRHVSAAREEVLERIRAALADGAAAPDVPREYAERGTAWRRGRRCSWRASRRWAAPSSRPSMHARESRRQSRGRARRASSSPRTSRRRFDPTASRSSRTAACRRGSWRRWTGQ